MAEVAVIANFATQASVLIGVNQRAVGVEGETWFYVEIPGEDINTRLAAPASVAWALSLYTSM